MSRSRKSVSRFLEKCRPTGKASLVALVPFAAVLVVSLAYAQAVTEAPAGFDNLTNGNSTQTDFNNDKAEFDQVENITDGLGPVYNAQSCRECHQNPVSGATSQITEFRAGHQDGAGNFVGATVTLHDANGNPVVIAGRSLINQRAICPGVDASQGFNFPNTYAQERITTAETIRTERSSLNLLGDGFVEAIASGTLLNIQNNQCNTAPGDICGLALSVPVLEAPGQTRVGRFGWKAQQASLLSFASDAYLNEMGITNQFNPTDVTNLCDTVADPEDKVLPSPPFPANFHDIDAFARFMRSLKVPPRDATLVNNPDVIAGNNLFNQIGCARCHVGTITTAPPGTVINGGALTVSAALGNKNIHPFSDFLLHDVGTGDNIDQGGGPDSAHRMRTPPLWGSRMHNQHMHDNQSTTFTDAILRHAGAATNVINNFRNLSGTQQRQLTLFLTSL
jgi:CxxC motif-containing protein (DUF1111 family)